MAKDKLTPKKNKVGRPKKFNEVEELQNKIKHYFDSITKTEPAFDYIKNGKKDDKGNDLFDKVPRLNNAGEQVMITTYFENPSVLGLCKHLEIHRDTLCEYEKKEEYSDTIKKAKAEIEQYLENQLYRHDQVTGIIFNLKNNFGWKDKTEVDNNINIKNKLEDFF